MNSELMDPSYMIWDYHPFEDGDCDCKETISARYLSLPNEAKYIMEMLKTVIRSICSL